MPPTFKEFIDAETAALKHRAAIRALELQTGVATDNMGEYWLARTCALEKVAYEATQAPYKPPALRVALDALEAIPAPSCREGDHEVERVA